MKLPDLARGLSQGTDGIWRSPQARTVSYPAGGHGTCFEVEDHSFWFRHRNGCILDLLIRHPPPDGAAILEIGGGNGAVAWALAKAGYDVALLEPGAEGAKNAHARGLRTVMCATLEDADFPRGSLKAVGLFDVIEHIEDDAGFLSLVHDRLQQGGRLYATVPSFPWLWSAEDIEAGHFRRYTRRTISLVLEQAGFEVAEAGYFFWPLLAPLFLVRSLAYRLGLASPGQAATHAARDHGTEGGFAVSVIARLLENERNRLAKGRQSPFGTSCLIAATRR